MITNNILKKMWLIVVTSLILSMTSAGVFAYGMDEHRGGGRHEVAVFRGQRYHYHEGRFYRPGLFWFNFDLVTPPAGVVVSYLPYGHRTIIVAGTTYYEYDNIYYQPCPAGYIVVQEPVLTNRYISPSVVYMPAPASVSPAQPQTGDRETVTINVPKANGGSIAITLVRYPTGFVGPQGEFYSTLPTTDQLRVLYGN
jgi:hypothetical protein